MMLGLPEIGKTQAFITIAMAMGRYWCRVRPSAVTGLPGWRRGKQFDNFRGRPQQLQDAVFLNDPNLCDISLADMKHFLNLRRTGLYMPDTAQRS